MRASRDTLIGGALTGLVLLPAGALALWRRGAPFALDIPHRLEGASLAHPLGTDPLGRSLLTFCLEGALNSALISAAATGIAALAGTALGLAASGDGKLSRAATGGLVQLGIAFPPVLIAALLVTLHGAGAGSEIAALALFFIPGFARQTEQAARALAARDFIAAARLSGRTQAGILADHVLPHLLPLLTVQASAALALAILSETGLSYLGLGLPPPAPDLGRLLASYQIHLFDRPLLPAVPILLVMALVLGFNLLGDGLRDRLDPEGRS